jgi:predicted O-methyltransferase YrrM
MAKLSIFTWFLRRPRYYRQFGRVGVKAIAQRVPGAARRDEDERELAEALCEARACSTDEALGRLLSVVTGPSLLEAHAAELKTAEERAETTPHFMGGPANLDLLYRLSEGLQATRVVETGVGYGWSSLSLLLSLKNRDGARLVSTDFPYLLPDAERYVGVVVPDRLRSGWALIRNADREALPKACAMLDQIDLCHYDSDKSYGGRLWAYRYLWPRLRVGGMLVSDDVGDNTAFLYFAEGIGAEPVIVRTPGPGADKFVGVLVKHA